MNQKRTDIWFGPGALNGVFGAGVAYGLQESFARQEIDVSKVRLFGSSVGCLTAVYLATGNAACGLDVFKEDTRELIAKRNLVPAIGARIFNRFVMASRRHKPIAHVPNVLNVAHVFSVVARRTPNIRDQLRRAPMPVFAESVYRTGKIRHAELRVASKPLEEIGSALNAYPFTNLSAPHLLDSAIQGYGFVDLLTTSGRALVVVLNRRPAHRVAEPLADVACAALCGDLAIARLYLRRRRNRYSAIRMAEQRSRDVLLVTPQTTTSLRRPVDVEQAYGAGKEATRRIVTFINQHSH
jgi:hypothetical protein